MNNTRLINEAVVVFLKRDNKYLLLKRIENQEMDPGLYNGVGGRVKIGETYLDTAVRKIKEESGYEVLPDELKFVGLAREEECEHGDWTMAFYMTEVEEETPPTGWKNENGSLEWVKETEVLKKNVVSDLKIFFPEVVKNKGVFFAVWKRKNNRSEITGIKVTRSQ
jgi:ADP-ribose pyrophosphatase YjhB (NUDIX family)